MPTKGDPQIVVASSAEQGVSAGAWLQSIKLSVCVDALSLAGYDEDLDMIQEADGEEVADMIAAVEGIAGEEVDGEEVQDRAWQCLVVSNGTRIDSDIALQAPAHTCTNAPHVARSNRNVAPP